VHQLKHCGKVHGKAWISDKSHVASIQHATYAETSSQTRACSRQGMERRGSSFMTTGPARSGTETCRSWNAVPAR